MLHEHTEDIGEVFVERARFVVIIECGRELRDAVRQLVSDHVERRRESIEQLSVAVAVDHLASVPHRVVEADAEVHGRIEAHAAAVD